MTVNTDQPFDAVDVVPERPVWFPKDTLTLDDLAASGRFMTQTHLVFSWVLSIVMLIFLCVIRGGGSRCGGGGSFEVPRKFHPLLRSNLIRTFSGAKQIALSGTNPWSGGGTSFSRCRAVGLWAYGGLRTLSYRLACRTACCKNWMNCNCGREACSTRSLYNEDFPKR